ncbi:hypothetical protein [Caulobacter sp. 1776]|uniref:hypothetical protein n=1 Tax=Caulobacter sp. 1776 TaxID=3156420 RepID=UPI00339562E0
MRERGDILVAMLAGFILVFPLGFVLHVSSRFPGSFAGGMLGILAVLTMLLTLPYVAAKHIGVVDRVLSRFVAKPTLLAVHVYAGVLAPLLALFHAAHKLDSPLGVMLTGLLLLTVLSGFVGRFLLAELARALRGRKSELASLKAAYLNLPPPPSGAEPPRPLGRLTSLLFRPGDPPTAPAPADKVALAAALSDSEYAVRAEAATSSLFAKWRLLHVVAGVVLYGLILLHVGAALYYGLRWL